MIDFRRFRSRILSFSKNLRRPFPSQDLPDERRGNFAESAKAGSTPSSLNGGLGDSSKSRETIAELQRASGKSQQDLVAALRKLASASDSKDPFARGHSERVTRFSVEIAKIMELPEEEIERIRIGALTHDIGKLTIDGEVLHKPASLTDSEYTLLKTHTTRGYELLKDIPQLREILPGIRSHHEQLDGKGYPSGLRGDEIPMIARIIAVADCFDAMITARPYQAPASTEQALEMIRSAAGLKYDDRVVDALINGVRTGRIMTRAQDRMKPEN
jgi:HD-GYP domain-containing protein (c-di-GMP phosphodiesterase class II)